MAEAAQDQRSLGDLLAELSRETGVLVRKEVELATTEMTAKAKEAMTDAGITAAGGALAHAGLLVLLAAIVIGLAQLGVQPWLSAAIVAMVAIGVGYVLVNRGLTRMRRINPRPANTVETLKETAAWTTGQRA
ncbi:MAG TPA: phage holin family protein [Vicinamibacterales bacterium]|nr:phage holin family protein [Vicinamibacterales bacterium]